MGWFLGAPQLDAATIGYMPIVAVGTFLPHPWVHTPSIQQPGANVHTGRRTQVPERVTALLQQHPIRSGVFLGVFL